MDNQTEIFIKLREDIVRLEEKITALKDAVTYALESAEKAIIKAEAANEKRLDSVNEFRNQMGDQQDTYITIKEANARFFSLEEKIEKLSKEMDSIVGQKIGAQNIWAYIIAAIGVMFGLITIFKQH